MRHVGYFPRFIHPVCYSISAHTFASSSSCQFGLVLHCCNCYVSLGTGGIHTVSLTYLHRQKSMGVWSGDLGRHCSKVGSLSVSQPICQCRRHSETVVLADDSVTEPHSAAICRYYCLFPVGVATFQHFIIGCVLLFDSNRQWALHILHRYCRENVKLSFRLSFLCCMESCGF